MSGEVEIDGAYFGGHIRPENVKADRVDRRLKKHQTGKRRVVIALRNRECTIKELAQKVVKAAMIAPKSDKFRGYWQRAT